MALNTSKPSLPISSVSYCFFHLQSFTSPHLSSNKDGPSVGGTFNVVGSCEGSAYHSTIMRNKHLFEGKVVLDVGTGSGALSIWCAQAGAAKVFACEYTDMAKHARALVEKNGLSHIVEVMQCSAEELDLPCKVDIIISEWMGYFLLRESMLDSVIRARNKWLKDGGSMFPSYATMYWSAVTYEDDREVKTREYNDSLNEWEKFSD
jgi:protein arginine N-methyltransferase 1